MISWRAFNHWERLVNNISKGDTTDRTIATVKVL